MSATQTSETKYFDLHTTGIGYLNRLREGVLPQYHVFVVGSV